MPRLIRNTAILAKIEGTYGVDAVPTGGANAMLVSNLEITPYDAENVDRDLVRPFLGASEQLVGTANIKCSFDIELAGSGDAGSAPAWGPVLRACAMEEIVGASFVEYVPRTNGQQSASIYWYDDGVLHKLLGAMGGWMFKLGVGNRPVISFNFIGLDGGMTAATNPAVTLTPFRTPKVVTDANSPGITFGGTYADGVASGGIAYTSTGIEISSGNEVSYTPLLGTETVDVTDRIVSATLQLDMTPAQEVAFHQSVKANALRTLTMEHGTEVGNIILVHGPAVQLFNQSKAEINKRRLIGFDARFTPIAGNDEIVLCVK